MKISAFLLSFLLTAGWTTAQDPVAQKFGNKITPDGLKEHLSILASDALEGRETGKRGQKMAAAFISNFFNELNLAAPVNGSYYQPLELYTHIQGETYLKIGQERFTNYEDVAYYGNADSKGEVILPVVFAGKGRPEDFSQLDVAGKAVLLMLNREDNFRVPVNLASDKKASIVFILNTENTETFRDFAGQIRNYLSGGILSLKKPESKPGSGGVFFVSPAVAGKMFNLAADKLKNAAEENPSKSPLKKIKSGQIAYKTSIEVGTVKTENVLGYLEGTDKKDELIVITAHYDHIGKKRRGSGDLINNGADDDGSGTVTVMELARAFAAARDQGNGPRRSILFMTVTGEEKGLLGSDYYTQNPVFPLSSTVVNLNIDMVGRRDSAHADSPPYVYVIGSDKLSTELHALSESVNKKYTNLVFDYTYNDQNHPDRLYYRSDHWNFAKNNIPVIFYFDGIHEDYHQPSDEVEKIEFDLLTKRAQCIFYTAWEIANRDERIRPDAK